MSNLAADKVVWSVFVGCLLMIGGIFIGSQYYYISPWHNVVASAVAVIHPIKDSKVHGVVAFKKVSGGVAIDAQLHNLSPGKHGLHIHQDGDCSCDDAECAGGHYNPTGQPHGGPDDARRHIGDLGNIIADASGNASYRAVDTHIQLDGPYSIIGRSVIIHADADDLCSQPSGNAGKRLGCGVIGING